MLNSAGRDPGSFSLRGRHLFAFDVFAVSLAVVGAIALRFDTSNPFSVIRAFLPVLLVPIPVQLACNVVFGLYRREWRYASIRELVAVTVSVATAGVISGTVILALGALDMPGTDGLPRSFVPLTSLLSLILIGGGRFAARVLSENRGQSWGREPNMDRVRSLVYGAGEAGAAIARMADRDPSMGVQVVGFVDDDARKRGSRLLGRRIYGPIDDLPSIARTAGARQLIVAMPSAPGSTVRSAVDAARGLRLDVRIVSGLEELLGTPDRSARLRPVSVDDLLRRDPVKVDLEELADYINGACIMVTGAGGSIGSELARQISRLGPRRLVLLDNNESSLWAIDRDLRDHMSAESVELAPVISDVREQASLDRIVAGHAPDVVFHAAALKHVPICELQPAQAALTNVIGTRNVLRACNEYGVGRFVLISTDKAVHPVSVMGATKRAAELLTLQAGSETGRSHIAVRFGNVLGSSGSVVPIFRRQMELGLPITITHPDATRYFMTIPEAVSLILQAGSRDATEEVYVLDMGDPVRIVDLAMDMIRLSGLDPAQVEIAYTGLRPGERLEERLFYDHESVEATHHERVWRITEPTRGREALSWAATDDLERHCRAADDRGVRQYLVDAGILLARHPAASSVRLPS